MSTFPETGFLDAIAAHVTSRAPSAKVGFAEPVGAPDLPAVVLSLDSVQRLGSGLGERSALITNGALQWTSTIALANPGLPEEPSFALFTIERPRELILPHGGLRQADGDEGPLGPADLTVKVNGTARTVVTGTPANPNEVSADPRIGLLRFGGDLAPTDTVVATYFLGQWERRVTPIAGVLRADVRAAAIGDVVAVSGAVFAALAEAAQPAVRGLRKISLTSLTSVGLPDSQRADSRGRTALYTFDYEHEVNRPDSSGGIIQRVDIHAVLKQGVSA